MSQILHIFYKDARRFWGEIFLSVAITAAFALVLSQHLDRPRSHPRRHGQPLGRLL